MTPQPDTPTEDAQMGAWVYCRSHVRAHSTGWCTVPARDKLALSANSREEAYAEVKAMGLPIHGYCQVCYAWIANDPAASTTRCAEHLTTRNPVSGVR